MSYKLIQRRTRFEQTIPYLLCSGSHIRISGAAGHALGLKESTWCKVYVDEEKNRLKIDLQKKPLTDCRRIYVQARETKSGAISLKSVAISFNANTNRLKYGYYAYLGNGEFEFTGLERPSLVEN